MKIRKSLMQSGAAFALSLFTASVLAAVSPEQAERLSKDLTPFGAERAGNAAGTIPEWTGGLPIDAAKVDERGFMEDPFAGEEPLFVITAANVEQYQDNLSPGQVALLKRYPNSFKIPVYKTHRTAAMPQEVIDATRENALNVNLIQDGNGLENFKVANAFPIPQNGLEVIWNHITRYRGGSVSRRVAQATPQTNGSYSLVYFDEQFVFPNKLRDHDPNEPSNILFYFKQNVTAPARLAGNVLLVHETVNQIAEPRMAWLYNAGQRRVRRAPQVAYDGPGTAADGLRTSDNLDMFNGAPDRYTWELHGKKEMYIPYNNSEFEIQRYFAGGPH